MVVVARRLFPSMFFDRLGFIGDEEEGGSSEDGDLNEGFGSQGESGSTPSDESLSSEDHMPEGGKKEGEEGTGRDEKNLMAENKRKGEEIKSLRDEITLMKAKLESIPKPQDKPKDVLEATYESPEARKSVDRLKERLGIDDNDVRDLIHVISYHSGNVYSNQIKPLMVKFANQDLESALEELSKDESNKFVISKYKPEIKKELIDRKVEPDLWGNPKVIDLILGSLTKKHIAEFSKGGNKKIDREVMQEDKTPNIPSGFMSGLNTEEVKEYGFSIGYTLEDMKDKSVLKAIAGAYKAKQDALKQ